MKQRVLLLFLLVALIGVLIGLNAAGVSQKERPPDNEYAPHRSTYNVGATGTSALYTLLAESGRKVRRWQEAPSQLRSAKGVSTFVIVGPVLYGIPKADADDILAWTALGHTLVIVDRDPSKTLLTTTANWRLSVTAPDASPEVQNADPAKPGEMTSGATARHPLQPTILTRSVIAVQPSIFASSIDIAPLAEPADDSPITTTDATGPDTGLAPVSHIPGRGGALLVSAPYGLGRIVFLTDPYIISNGGIGLADNAQLGIDLADSRSDFVAFDEYHQGYGINDHHLFQFFAGTPVVPIFLQLAALVGLVFYSRSRRFGRPTPERVPDRLSKLEYVSAMAELQNRARAYDLALENIYSEFRRRAAMHFGLNGLTAGSTELAGPIAERARMDASQVRETLFKIEDIIRGEPTKPREAMHLVTQLRAIESAAGLSRLKRGDI